MTLLRSFGLKYLILLKRCKESNSTYHLTCLNIFSCHREILHEDKSFPQRELAALVVSKVYHHLGSFEDSLTYALGAGNLFDVMSNSEYVQTTIAKCMDFYSQQQVAQAEGCADVKPVDPR